MHIQQGAVDSHSRDSATASFDGDASFDPESHVSSLHHPSHRGISLPRVSDPERARFGSEQASLTSS